VLRWNLLSAFHAASCIEGQSRVEKAMRHLLRHEPYNCPIRILLHHDVSFADSDPHLKFHDTWYSKLSLAAVGSCAVFP
jgi:hypothetical protein